MERYKKIFKEEVEKYKSSNNLLQSLIELHNDCDTYITHNEKQIKLGNEKYIENFIKLVNKFHRTFKEKLHELFKELNVPNNIQGRVNRRFQNAESALFYANKETSNIFPTDGVGTYSTLHECLKILIEQEQNNGKI